MEANSFLEKEKIGKLMLKYSIPCILSLLVGALYNMVDQVYIGWGVGYLGNGATNVVFPLTVVVLAFATMIGDGACTFVSISLGRKDQGSAKGGVGNAIVIALVCSTVLTVGFTLFQEPILRVFGATENNLPYAKEYFTYLIIGIPFYLLTNALNPIIRSDGSPRFAMAAVLVGAVLNVILDPIAIFVFHWGMMGAAVATVVGQVVSAGLSVLYLFRMKAVKLDRGSFRLQRYVIQKMIPMGFCSFLSQISMVISMAFTLNMLGKYGADTLYGADIPLTVVGIVCKYFQIVISIVIGMAAGCIPIVGYNIGAGRRDRVRTLLQRLMAAEALVGTVAFALFQCFPRQLISVFGTESELYMEFAVITFRIYLSMVILACINKAAFIFLQAMGKALLSTFLSFFREVLLTVPIVLLLPRYLGLYGVLYSMPVPELIAFIASLVVLISTHRSLKDAQAPLTAAS